MKGAITFVIPFILFISSSAQLKRPAPPQKKIKLDSLKLACPVANGLIKRTTDTTAYKGDLKVTIKSSTSDSLFLAPADGKIDLVTIGDNGKNEIVMHYFNFNIWLTGIARSLVKKNDMIKKGQPIAMIEPGDEVELLLFDDELPVDPKKVLGCKSE